MADIRRHRLRRASDACRTSRRCCRISKRSGATRSRSAASTRWSRSAIRRRRRSPRGRNGAARTGSPATDAGAARRRRCSTAGRPASRSATASMACSFCSARTWRRRSAARSTTGSRKEWLDRDPRLRASIVVPMQNVEYAVDEIERCAKDRRFVQVLVLAMQEVPLGRRHFWPIYAAGERHGLPLGIHAGSTYRNPVTSLGWPTWYIEDYASQSQGFQSQVASLISEGVFAKYPGAQGRADRIGRDLAARLPVAVRQVLAGLAHRGAVGRPRALGDRARPFPPDHPAVRRARRAGSGGTGDRAPAFRRYTALRVGLSALAVRRRRGDAGRAFRRRCGARSWSTIRSRPTPG